MKPNEFGIFDLPQKTNALAVTPVHVRQLKLVCFLSHLRFCEMPNWKENSRKLRLAEPRKKIGLVLDRIRGALEVKGLITVLDLRVMPGRDLIKPAFDLIKEESEFNPLVAENVRTRGPASLQFADHVRNDPLLIFALQSDHPQRDSGLLTNRTSAFQIIFPRAIAQKGEFVLQPYFQIECGYLVWP